jgi:hypothetical protein
MKTMVCDHGPCTCAAQEGTAFCSESCAEAQGSDRAGDRCACGHPECAEAGRGTAPGPSERPR